MATRMVTDYLLITDDFLHEGEISGAKASFNMTRASQTISGTEYDLEVSGILTGVPMPKAGSITSVTLCYFVGTTAFLQGSLRIKVNGATEITENIPCSVGGDNQIYFTYVRDTEDFTAEDVITATVEVKGVATVSLYILTIEVIQDT